MTKKGRVYLDKDLEWWVFYVNRKTTYPISNETSILDTSKYKILNSITEGLEEEDIIEFEVMEGNYSCGRKSEYAKIINLIK